MQAESIALRVVRDEEAVEDDCGSDGETIQPFEHCEVQHLFYKQSRKRVYAQ